MYRLVVVGGKLADGFGGYHAPPPYLARIEFAFFDESINRCAAKVEHSSRFVNRDQQDFHIPNSFNALAYSSEREA
jgi:hypothetical protein